MPVGGQDFSAVLPKIKANEPELLLVFVYGQDPQTGQLVRPGQCRSVRGGAQLGLIDQRTAVKQGLALVGRLQPLATCQQ